MLGTMIDCTRRSLRLSDKGCIALFHSANGTKAPAAWEGRAACRGCVAGAMRATGRAPDPMAEILTQIAKICARCGRTPERLIWGIMCPSCDARQREAVCRRNSKGNPPRLSGIIHTERLVISSAKITKMITRTGVIDVAEAIMQAARRMDGPTAFGRRKVNWMASVHAGRNRPWGQQYELGI